MLIPALSNEIVVRARRGDVTRYLARRKFPRQVLPESFRFAFGLGGRDNVVTFDRIAELLDALPPIGSPVH